VSARLHVKRTLTYMNIRTHVLSLRSSLKDWVSLILRFMKSVKKCLVIDGDVAYH
jgi:hypothetical protein